MLNFGERLRTLRKKRGVSQVDLAKALGLSERALQSYEASEREPKIGIVKACADYFGVSSSYLLDDLENLRSLAPNATPEEAEFLRWVQENVEEVFFFEFDKSPEAAKKQLMADLRYMWEREKKRGSK